MSTSAAHIIGHAALPDVRLQLRWLADTYERVQRIRIDSGERIRAVAQGRAAGATVAPTTADMLLRRIRAAQDNGPIPVLGCTYRVHWNEEQRLRAAMIDALSAHPAWPWLQQVKGMGPTLATKLLARLDIMRAPTPSSFWSYCGLATVPAERFRCMTCGAVRVLTGDRYPHAAHKAISGEACAGVFERERHIDELRVAPVPARRGERNSYDRTARRICYQIGVALLRARGPYAAYYRRERFGLANSTREWTRAHIHMAALRKTQKLLLSHLWAEWACAVGIQNVRPYAHARLLRSHYIAAADMVST